MQLKRVIISGGGTGGHIFPAIAIANALKEMSPGIEILFVGAQGKMEMEKVPAAGYQIIGLNISGLQRKLAISNLWLPFKLLGALMKAGKIINQFKPQVAVGVGGYASAALVYMAAKKGIPVLIQEQNSYPGKTNRFLAKYASRICVAYPGMEQYFEKNKIVLTGNPVRQDIEKNTLTKEQGIQFFNLDPKKKTVFAFGGSQGAKAINEGMENALDLLEKNHIQAIWQTGKHYYQRAKSIVDEKGYNHIRVYEFIERMNYAYAAADLVISRSGAIAVAELSILGKASILVPLPTAAEDHQTKNAMALVNRNVAVLLKNEDCPKELGTIILKYIENDSLRNQLEQQIKSMANYDAAKIIASEIINLAK